MNVLIWLSVLLQFLIYINHNPIFKKRWVRFPLPATSFFWKHLYTILTIDIFGDNMTDKITSMQIHESTLDKLHDLKGRGQSYEDVVLMLLQVYENYK